MCGIFVMKKKKKEPFIDRDQMKKKMAEMSGMPKDVVLGMPIVTITGQVELHLQNYRGIIEYTDALIRIQTKVGQMKVTGKRMKIEYYTNDEMKIDGKITSVEYQ